MSLNASQWLTVIRAASCAEVMLSVSTHTRNDTKTEHIMCEQDTGGETREKTASQERARSDILLSVKAVHSVLPLNRPLGS